jgi:alpha-galactosidase
MLQVGNGHLTSAENRAHFYLWAVLNAPLMAGSDLTRMSDEVRDLLIHSGIIEIDQDWSGEQGKLTWSEGDLQVWSKQMSEAAGGGVAAVLLNRGDASGRFNLETAVGSYSTAKDVWSGDSLSSTGSLEVEPHGALLLRLS